MRWSETWRDAWEGVRSQPGRAALSFLSVAIGMAALTVLLAIVGGLSERTREVIRGLGVSVFGIVSAGVPDGRGGSTPLQPRHVEYLAANLPGCAVTGLRLYDSAVTGLDRGTTLVASDEDLIRVRPWRVVAGRFLDREEVRGAAHCAAVSEGLARAMSLSPGVVVRVRDIPFRVIGVVDTRGGAGSAPVAARPVDPGEMAIFVPRTVLPFWLRDGARPEPRLDAIYVKVEESARFGRVLALAGDLLATPDYRASAVSWITPQGLVEQLARLERLIAWSGGAVVCLCLLLGGTTLMSLLLADVRERIPEIGLRRALGASRTDIGLLFLCDACVITAAASAAGAGVAYLGLRAAASAFPLPLATGPAVVAVPVLAGLALGVIFSFWPARTAAGITPSEALRNE